MNKAYTLFNLFLSFIRAKNPHGYPVHRDLYSRGVGMTWPGLRIVTIASTFREHSFSTTSNIFNLTDIHHRVGKTENGWTDDFQCLKWFTESFIPQARARAGDDNEPILLVVDGHGSHVTKEMAKAGLAHNVHLFCLPPHTTHKLQPLDVGCFGLLTRKWLERCEAVIEATRENILKGDFVREYMNVRKSTMTQEIITAAWKKTGLFPFNAAIFSDDNFAPSNITSTQVYVPHSFPLPMDVDYDSEAESPHAENDDDLSVNSNGRRGAGEGGYNR